MPKHRGRALCALRVFALAAAALASPTRASPPTGSDAVGAITNARVFMDMVQNDPGDSTVAWQQTKYSDPRVLARLGYTGQVPTGEIAPSLAVDYGLLGDGADYFPAGSPERSWIDGLAEGIDSMIADAEAAGLDYVPFTDMLVFPKAVLAAYPGATVGGHVAWNNVTQRLLAAQIDGLFARFPGVDGLLVRTGETYTYDDPYWGGNSPTAGVPSGAAQIEVWVSFITWLRQEVCERHGKALYFRAWDSFAGWTGDPAYYLNVTDPVPTHPSLYFSVKHTAGDFFRYMAFNGQVGVGKHAQIIEVELQREYEGKMATPDYILRGVIDGFNDLGPSQKIGLRDVVRRPQIKGIWTWSRGGGWWGPYIHGQELWVDLHVNVLARWWGSNATLTEADAFDAYCTAARAGDGHGRAGDHQGGPAVAATNGEGASGLDLTAAACADLRSIALASADAVLQGHYCPEQPGHCWTWTRDDRLGGLQQLGAHFDFLGKGGAAAFKGSLAHKRNATSLFAGMLATYNAGAGGLAAAMTAADPRTARFLNTSLLYGVHLYGIVDAAWEVFTLGWQRDHAWPSFNATALAAAIAVYDARWAAYSVFGLSHLEAPSLYKPYYFNLPGQAPQAGMGATVDKYRAPNATAARGATGHMSRGASAGAVYADASTTFAPPRRRAR